MNVIYKVLKPWFLKHYYLDQPKKSGFENMNKAFVDRAGRVYYTPKNDFDYPIIRVKELQKRLIRLDSGLNEQTIELFLDAMDKALGKGKLPDVARIGFLVHEMKARKEILIDNELFIDILALRFIRADENPAVIDKEIHEEKVKQFTEDSAEGLYDFFYKMGLITLIPYLSKLEEDWEEYTEMGLAKMKAHEIHLKTYLTGQS